MWELLWIELGQLGQVGVSHIYWKVLRGLYRIKLAEVVLNELPKTVVIWRCVAITTDH